MKYDTVGSILDRFNINHIGARSYNLAQEVLNYMKM